MNRNEAKVGDYLKLYYIDYYIIIKVLRIETIKNPSGILVTNYRGIVKSTGGLGLFKNYYKIGEFKMYNFGFHSLEKLTRDEVILEML